MTTRTYYLSKYALSAGIEAVECSTSDKDGYIVRRGFVLKLGRDIHETRAEAVQAAEAVRVKKIASLRKQIAKLEAMKFEE